MCVCVCLCSCVCVRVCVCVCVCVFVCVCRATHQVGRVAFFDGKIGRAGSQTSSLDSTMLFVARITCAISTSVALLHRTNYYFFFCQIICELINHNEHPNHTVESAPGALPFLHGLREPRSLAEISNCVSGAIKASKGYGEDVPQPLF